MIMHVYFAGKSDPRRWESAFPVCRFHSRWFENNGAECLMIDYDIEPKMWPMHPWSKGDGDAVMIQDSFGPGDRLTVTDWDGNELLRYPRVQQ